MTTTFNMHEAKTHLSRLVAQVVAGQEVIIAKAGKPLVKVVPLSPVVLPPKRKLGPLKSKGIIVGDIKRGFEKEIDDLFYGNPAKFER